MRKRDELLRVDSCMSRAGLDEMVFVLRGHDIAASFTIRAWVNERIRLNKNKSTDRQIVEALSCAQIMDDERNR